MVFAELSDKIQSNVADMRTVLAVYNIRELFPRAYILCEIINHYSSALIKRLRCNDIIFKEKIDADFILCCLKHPYISTLLYDLLNLDKKTLRSIPCSELVSRDECTYHEVFQAGIANDICPIGYFDASGKPRLAPDQNEKMTGGCRLIIAG
ncbi:MAG TPA: hypothetical protein DC049_17460 [Spirochaetia bacterium]|nr:hypothetical protein [Spirochaetia bacterium]